MVTVAECRLGNFYVNSYVIRVPDEEFLLESSVAYLTLHRSVVARVSLITHHGYYYCHNLSHTTRHDTTRLLVTKVTKSKSDASGFFLLLFLLLLVLYSSSDTTSVRTVRTADSTSTNEQRRRGTRVDYQVLYCTYYYLEVVLY